MKKHCTYKDYPLMSKSRSRLSTPSGKGIDDITFENALAGIVSSDDCRTSRESLVAQAEIAESMGNTHIAQNFRRAAEMTSLDSDYLLSIYNALRPYRSTNDELVAIANELEQAYHSPMTAKFIKEAAAVLGSRKKLNGDRTK